MSLTADVKAELTAVRDPRPTARVAELTSLLRFSGGLHSIANRVAVEAELDSDVLARRVARDLMEIYGVRPELVHVQGSGARNGSHYAVRVIEGGETLARQTGLLDQRRRPVRGLPNKLTTGSRGRPRRDLARRVPRRRARSASPGARPRSRSPARSGEAAMALVGAAHRLGIPAKAREVRGVPRVVVREGEAIRARARADGRRARRRRVGSAAPAPRGARRRQPARELRRRQPPPLRAGRRRRVRARRARARDPRRRSARRTCARRASCASRTATRASTSSATTPTRR